MKNIEIKLEEEAKKDKKERKEGGKMKIFARKVHKRPFTCEQRSDVPLTSRNKNQQKELC